jgi:DNA-binding XRE family transcriptional regulator
MKQLRSALGGISQERFAHQLGVTTRTMVRWENGDTITPRVLVTLRDVAIGAKQRELADVFEQRLREDLGWRMMPE